MLQSIIQRHKSLKKYKVDLLYNITKERFNEPRICHNLFNNKNKGQGDK